ncbi:hypothetical protein Sru01_14420 [Sphaerisporangium rufum]|uniref:Uncharacterized protein n=1 Tax=Sphaerisporangium rufum TaxID=1381558 RepID=A0A919R3J2_9ACTN|nr:hypothetical protein [Sphaerisporangium rufum]GII76460.1 hypothetical protein Sru01_14420 [Sphaerisporangium rufum]
MHLRHRWETIETIGYVITQRCAVCGRTRTRVRDHPPVARDDTAPAPPATRRDDRAASGGAAGRHGTAA